ncbi:MAG: hypothetical protein EBQ54_01135 [Actinobacteria bacterium]|nr:hypothetical protein [Actinomycetota bacterium]
MIVGETVSYHWFSYAWIGAVSNLANVKLELILPLFGPVIIAGVCVILGFAITRAVLSHSLYAILGVACAVFFDTEKLFRGFGFHVLQISSLSQFFSLPFGLVIVLLLAKLNAKELRAIALIIGFVFAGAIGSKSSSGLFVLLGLFGILCVWLLERSEIVAKIRFAVVGVIVPAIISGLIFYGNPLNGAESKIRRPRLACWGVARSLGCLQRRYCTLFTDFVFPNACDCRYRNLFIVAYHIFRVWRVQVSDSSKFFTLWVCRSKSSNVDCTIRWLWKPGRR